MAASDYLKTAAAELHRAALHLEQQIHTMTSESERHAHQRAQEITRHQLDLKLKQGELNTHIRTDNDPGERARLEREIHDLQQQINEKQHEIQRVQAETAQRSSTKQHHREALLGKARELETLATTPELTD